MKKLLEYMKFRERERESIGREEKRQNTRITWFGLEAYIHNEMPLTTHLHYNESSDTIKPNGVYIGG